MLLLHASKTIERDALRSVRERFPQIALPALEDFETGGIVGIATLAGVVSSSDSPWFVGPYGYVLEDVWTLPFMPLKGQLGLFPAPRDLLVKLAAYDYPGTRDMRAQLRADR